jgi:hypothetical protein
MKGGLQLLVMAALVFATATAAHAADVQVWTAAGASLFPSKRLELTIEPQVRFDENASRVSATFLDTGLQYRIVKWLRLGVGYRPGYERDGSGYMVLRHRLNADARTRFEINPFRIGYRLRLQEQIRPSSRDQYRTTLRNLIDLSYRGWKQWTPGLSVELFHALGDFDGIELDKIRFTVGTRYRIQKQQDLEVFYGVELPQADPTAPMLHIFGLTYHYDFFREG